jgi:hypothetical protein
MHINTDKNNRKKHAQVFRHNLNWNVFFTHLVKFETYDLAEKVICKQQKAIYNVGYSLQIIGKSSSLYTCTQPMNIHISLKKLVI